jgi:hypothetical protein
MIPFLPGWTLLAKFAVPLLVVGGVAAGIWGYGHSRYKAGERAVEARYLEQRLEAEAEDRRIEQKRASLSQGVQDAYRVKAAKAVASAAAAKSELDGLRSDLAARSGESPDAATASRTDGTAIFRELLGECAAEYTSVAQSADEANGRLAALQSWVTWVCLDAEPAPAR